MAHIEPLSRDQLTDLEGMFKMVEAGMGFVPASMLTMARWPELLQSFSSLAGTILGGGTVDPGLKQLVAFVSSNASGCRYCQAHTSHTALHRGIDQEKLNAAFEFETSSLFSDAERAALRLAIRGGVVPNEVEAEHFDELKKHFDEREIVEIVGVIALFGYLNRWNDTMATTLEDIPLGFANDHLTRHGWAVGKHES